MLGTHYRYLVIHFQPSLQGGENIQPLAVVVQDTHDIVAMAVHPSKIEGTIGLAEKVLRTLPEMLTSQLRAALKENPEDPLSAIQLGNRWTLFASDIQTRRSGKAIDLVALEIFDKEVGEFYRAKEGAPEEEFRWEGSRLGRMAAVV